MSRTRIKICGVQSAACARAAVDAGADAVGFILHAPGRRRMVTPEVAREICLALPPFVTAVGVVVDPPAFGFEQLLRRVPVDLIQFHGKEPPGVCAKFGRRATKVVSEPKQLDLWGKIDEVVGLTFDKPAGGTGEALDWQALRPTFETFTAKPLTLAGGLMPENVGEAVRLLRPYAVDVSSGVEGEDGRKSPERIRNFVEAVRNADANP